MKAFPKSNMQYQTGMDLRDYFAAKAMQGIIMHPNGKAGLWDEAAEDAYLMADAMMEARKPE